MRQGGAEVVDRALGALAPGRPLVLTGPSGCGRTSLALELTAAAAARNERVQLVTSVPPSLLLDHAASLGLDLAPAVCAGRLALLELDVAAPGRIGAAGGEGFVAALRADMPDANLLVLHPVSALTREIGDDANLRDLLSALFGACADAEQRVVSTVEDDALRTRPALARAMAELCGAHLRLSTDTAGRRFVHVEKSPPEAALEGTLEIARLVHGARADAAAPRRLAPRPVRPPRILVVEDDVVQRRQMVEWLGERYAVSEVDDGFTALSEVLAHPPDLVVLDLVLPRVGGADLLAALARSGDATPALVVSARMSRATDRVRILALGATDTLAKPLHRIELLRKVELLTALPKVPRPPSALRDAAALLAATASTRVLDAETFTERVRRAVRFGEIAEIPSTLLGIESERPEDLEVLAHAADGTLRTEDAFVVLSERRALILLVAASPAGSDAVVRRLGECLADNGVELDRLVHGRTRADAIEPPASGAAGEEVWKPCFERLAPWGETSDAA